jgi:hypothetical protein
MRRYLTAALVFASLLFAGSQTLTAQVTTGSMSGQVLDEAGAPVSGASVIAVHEPSGSRYGAITRNDGRFSMPGLRVGGPYRLTVSHIGFETEERGNVEVNLGVATELMIRVRERAVEVEGITVTGERREAILSPDRTGAATTVSREAIANVPTIAGRIESVARLTPQSSGMSFAGQDSRLNNITIDGSYFNNSFGLGNTPGDRTGVAPVSLAAIEQVQINVAPFDVRHGRFVGAGVNSVTRSGTNDFRGSLYYQFRDQDLVGTKAGDFDFDPGTFEFSNIGGWLAGPIIQNKLFFFANYEDDALKEPGTTFLANTGAQSVGGSITRVRAASLDSLSTYLSSNFDYQTGPYQGYTHETPARRFLAKVDFNVSDRNKLSLRYNQLDSNTDVLLSNSSSLGFGTRRTNTNGLNFQNSNYKILENIRSVVGEWNSMIGQNKANNLIIGYSYSDESRESVGSFFPMVDILDAGTVYTTFGAEPFTPNNELRYKSLQFQNNFSIFGERHTLTFGATAERYESENVFFPGSQSVYTYNSLADFYTDANFYLSNPNRTCPRTTTPTPECQSPVTLRRFQVRWMNIPNMEKPIQPLEVWYTGIYGQDEFQVNDKLKLTAGVRIEVPFFGKTAFQNDSANALTFRDEDGNSVQYDTGKLPDAKPLFSPRLGFNYDATGDRSTQIRGGTGIFTGTPAYVWISNQIGTTGVLTGFEELNNTRARPFDPDPTTWKPTNVTGAPASSYELAVTDPDFKFPQLWRTNVAVDQQLPLGVIGTLEGLYNKDINGVYYINANLPAAQSAFVGADTRARWTSNRINANVANNIVLKNQSEGYSWNVAASLERPFENGLFLKAAYSYGESKNTVDPGSIAFGSFNNNQHAGDPNNPGLGYSFASPGHRVFLAASYRAQWFKFGATSIGLFWEGRNGGNISYTYSGDLNGDGGTSNDLLYIPRDASEMNFQAYQQGASGTTPARDFSVAEQQAAWEAYIQNDDYLREHRGQYAERGGVFLPMVYRADLQVTQELFADFLGARNGISLRADILNVGNMINSDWGIGQRFVNTQMLIVPSSSQGGPADLQGRAQYRMRSRIVNGQHELITQPLEPTAGIGDVYRVQFSLRYTFN